MPAITAYIPFVLISLLFGEPFTVYYGSESNNDFTLYRSPKESTGSEPVTLCAITETRFFETLDADNHLYLEEAKIFLDVNNTRRYLYFSEETQLVQTTMNVSEASSFTLITTPELHQHGHFSIQYTASNMTGSGTSESYSLIMPLREYTRSQDGPYHLSLNNGDEATLITFEIRGNSTTLPGLHP